MATQDAIDKKAYYVGGTDVAVADGGTGSSTAAAARTALGLNPASIWLDASVAVVEGTAGAARSNTIALTAQDWVKLAYLDASTCEATWWFVMPIDWNGGTFTASVHFIAKTAAGTGNFLFVCSAALHTNNNTLDINMGSTVTITFAALNSNTKLCVTGPSGAITPAGSPASATAGQLCAFKLLRNPADAGDTAGSDAHVLGVELAYTRA